MQRCKNHRKQIALVYPKDGCSCSQHSAGFCWTPKSIDGHFFWTGKSKLHSAIGKWQRRLQTRFTLAEVHGGHAHRFRDTFAVELLLAGVPLEHVSVLLGHQSVRITERHYSPWVR